MKKCKTKQRERNLKSSEVYIRSGEATGQPNCNRLIIPNNVFFSLLFQENLAKEKKIKTRSPAKNISF